MFEKSYRSMQIGTLEYPAVHTGTLGVLLCIPEISSKNAILCRPAKERLKPLEKQNVIK